MSAGAASGGITTMNEFEGEGVVEGREVERVSVESSETDDDGSRQKMLAGALAGEAGGLVMTNSPDVV